MLRAYDLPGYFSGGITERMTERSGSIQALVIVAVTVIVVVAAYGITHSALTGQVSIEALLIFMLIAPSVCLPAIAFSSHAKAQKASGEIIRRTNLQLELVMDNMAQGLCMFDGDQRLIVCNQRYAEMYGLSPEIVRPGTTFREILQYRINSGQFAGIDSEAYIEERMAAVRERDMSAKTQQLNDGRYVAIRHTPMPGGGWLATHEDVTDIRKAELALMESEARLRAIFDNSPFCVSLKDIEGRFIFANKRYGEWWGCSVEEALGKTSYDLHKNPVRTQGVTELERLVLETGETQEKEVAVDRGNSGTPDHRLLIKFPVKSPEGAIIAIGTFGVDISERKRAEVELINHRDHLQELVDAATHDLKAQARELETALVREKEMNELQRQFISMASHEFRTPLAIIDSTAQRLKKACETMSPEDMQKRADKIRAAVNRMTQLMESTLTAARMENGKVKFEVADCNVAGLLWDVCERQGEVSAGHEINCDVSGLPDSIRADASALEQIFTNLLGNAVKYAPENPEIDVTATTEGDDIVVTVRDYGIGMDADDMARIGERFFRAKTSMGIAGTGIGLNLVKNLVEMHTGRLDVESELGKGSTFAVRLPIAGPPQAGLDEQDEPHLETDAA